ncbi:hypothetical protein B9Z55_010426 [Caenorhabditis nigoni]|uniref:Uncharacterized protein n=1 Tax=Caenorhabditis nigoni TaxID=1611254 RepID=A0A2G5UFT2_9PELO|nr:hypothetical protein B9Z55_010426 [Caenorhabditis nigoni]
MFQQRQLKTTATGKRTKKTTAPKGDWIRGFTTTPVLRTEGAVTRSQFKLREELGMNKETKKTAASRKRDKSNSRSRSRSRSQSSARKQPTTSRQTGRAKKRN